MARLYLDFKSNIVRTDNGEGMSPSIDYINFVSKEEGDPEFSISPVLSDFALDKDGNYTARWKGVNYLIYKTDDADLEIEDVNWIPQEIRDGVLNGRYQVDSVGLYIENYGCTQINGDNPMITNLSLELCHAGGELKMETPNVGVEIQNLDRGL